MGKKTVAAAARVAFISVVCAHYLLHMCFLNEVLESWQICLIEVARVNVLRIICVAVPLRTAVNGEVLGACVGLKGGE